MAVRLISGPAPIVTPADIPGSHSANDPAIMRMILAAQRTIDGPSGWVGRAFGKQQLEVWLDGFCSLEAVSLFTPATNIVSVTYLDRDEEVQTVDPAFYRRAGDELIFRRHFAAPATTCAPDAVRVRFDAGYEADAVPPEAKDAVILMALHAKAAASENLFLRSEVVEGVGTFQYTVSDQAGAVIEKAVFNLLHGLRTY